MIYCGIASLPEREANLRLTVKSLIDQVDVMFIALNGYSSVPNWINREPKIKYDLLDNSLGDSAKFLHVEECDGYYFSCDDDLVYNKSYVYLHLEAQKTYNSITTFHGRRYDKRPLLHYKKDFTLNLHCLNTVDKDTQVHVGGTGVMAFNTKQFKVAICDFNMPNMADLWIAKLAKQQNIPIMVLAHRLNTFRYMRPRGKTIWQMTKDDSYQTNLLRQICNES
jgi:CheY-like chemotaxis protein